MVLLARPAGTGVTGALVQTAPPRVTARPAFAGTRPAFSVQFISQPVKVGEEFGFQVQARSARCRLELFDLQEIG